MKPSSITLASERRRGLTCYCVCCGVWSSSLPEEMTISAFIKEPLADEDDGPGVRGRRCHDPLDSAPEPPAGADAQDLPIAGDVEEDGQGGEEDAMWTAPERGLNSRG